MLVIQDILISEEIIEEKFHCDLTACKGACCTEGDYGAPVDAKEMEYIHQYIDIIFSNLPERSVAKSRRTVRDLLITKNLRSGAQAVMTMGPVYFSPPMNWVFPSVALKKHGMKAKSLSKSLYPVIYIRLGYLKTTLWDSKPGIMTDGIYVQQPVQREKKKKYHSIDLLRMPSFVIKDRIFMMNWRLLPNIWERVNNRVTFF